MIRSEYEAVSSSDVLAETASRQAWVSMPPEVMVGVNASEALHQYAQRVNVGRVVVAFDTSASQVARAMAGSLGESGIAVVELEVDQPCRGYGYPVEVVEEIAGALRGFGADLLVSMGSPCLLCASKLARVRLHRPTLSLGEVYPTSVLGVRGRRPLHVAVPVGSGVGREADPLARAWGRDGFIVVFNRELVPDAVVVDYSLSPMFRPAEAMDAVLDMVAHAFEAVSAANSNLLTLGLAPELLRRLKALVERLGAPGGDPRARDVWVEAAIASLYTGLITSSSGVSLVCALAVATQEAFPELDHGGASAVYLPLVLQLYEMRNPSVAARLRFALQKAGIPGDPPSRAARMLLDKLGAPRSLEELDLQPDSVLEAAPRIASRALRLGACWSPVRVSRRDLEALVRAAATPGGGSGV